MRRLRRMPSLPVATLSVFFASVFLLGSTVSAQTVARPLNENDTIIQIQAEQVKQRVALLQSTDTELEALEKQKKSFADQIETEKKKIAELKQRIAAKKAAEKRAAQATVASAVHTSTTPSVAPTSGGGLRGGCGDNQYAAYIYAQESGGRVVGMCNPSAVNAGGCRGIGQACPGSKLPCGADYACQNAWFTSYMQGRYGSWLAAYNFHRSNGWW